MKLIYVLEVICFEFLRNLWNTLLNIWIFCLAFFVVILGIFFVSQAVPLFK